MVKFGDKLREEERPEWREGYIDYEGLKTSINELAELKDDSTAPPSVLQAKQHIFQGFLDREIEKVGNSTIWGPCIRPSCRARSAVCPRLPHLSMACMQRVNCATASNLQVLAFYKGKLADVQSRAAAVAAHDGGTDSGALADEQSDTLRDLAADITHLLYYISLNLAGEEHVSGLLRLSLVGQNPGTGLLAISIICAFILYNYMSKWHHHDVYCHWQACARS